MSKTKWMQSAVKHPGALRATAKRKGLLKGNAKLSTGALSKLSMDAKKTGNTKLAKRVNLAKTFKRFGRGR